MEYLKIGYPIKTHGIDGTLKVVSTTDFKEERFALNSTVFINIDGLIIKEQIEVVKFTPQNILVKFKGISSIAEAEKYIGKEILVLKDASFLNDGEYFFDDLLGCSVIDENGNKLGTVIKIEEFSATRTLRIEKDNKKTFFVPFVSAFIKKVDINAKEITIKLIEGLL